MTTLTTLTTSNTPLAIEERGALRGAIALAVICLAGCGFLYSLAGVGLGQAAFADAANGSLVTLQHQVRGSALVAQPFEGDAYFQPRPSAAAYNPMALAGSNQARTNPEMRQRIEDARQAVARRAGGAPATLPGDLVTQSGGGIDPHISPEAAAIQVARVARARGLAPDTLRRLLAAHTEPRQWGLFGAPRVNVLELNIALDAGARP